MAKKERAKTELEYLLQMKEYLGDDKMQQYVNDSYTNRTSQTRKGIIHAVNTAHALKHGREKPVPMPLVNEPIKHERKPRKDKFSI